MTFFEGMHVSRTQRVLNVLLEAPFFYVEDDAELFAYLRRHRVELARFFAEAFDWQLVVEPSVARVHKSRWHNDAITRKQRATFEPTRVGECVALLLLVDLYERERGGQAPNRFTMGELLRHGAQRLGELGLAERYDEGTLRDLYRDLLPVLIRHRFVRDAGAAEGAAQGPPMRMYEMRPGLGLYDARALGETAIREALGTDEASS